MKHLQLLVVAAMVSITTLAQDTPRRSYKYFGDVGIEDNSFLLEEAFNQGQGVIQHVATFALDKIRYETFQFGFTQEIPIANSKHQFSYSLAYAIHPKSALAENNGNGFGDMTISYRPLLFDENDWLMLIPRVSVIAPTGNSELGLGSGGWGLQVNVAVTKRLSKRFITHFNLGATETFQSDHYILTDEKQTLAFERNLFMKNIGASAVWLISNKANFLVEYVSTFNSDINDDGSINKSVVQCINPALRFAINKPGLQIVPGIGMPTYLRSSQTPEVGLLFYLSIETSY